MFQAFYEDCAKLEGAAKANGWDGEGSALDYAEARDHCVSKSFTDKDEAVAWVQAEINAMKTVFGVGDVEEIEEVGRHERCQYCTCGGHRRVHRYVVGDAGIEDDETLNDCADDD